MPREVLAISHRDAEKARRDFNSIKRKKNGLDFDAMYSLFKGNSHTLADISKIAGISRERVRQLYVRYFQNLFEWTGGRDRRHQCFLQKNLENVKEVEDESFERFGLMPIVENARQAGCLVSGCLVYIVDLPKRLNPRQIVVNGHACRVHKVTSSFTPDSAHLGSYAPCNLARSTTVNTYATVFYVSVFGYEKRIFVIPSELLFNAYFRANTITKKKVYIPLVPVLSFKKLKPRVDFWQYEKAWHHCQNDRV